MVLARDTLPEPVPRRETAAAHPWYRFGLHGAQDPLIYVVNGRQNAVAHSAAIFVID